jgi:hypothetical protein
LSSEVLGPLPFISFPQIFLFTFQIIFILLINEMLIDEVPKSVTASYANKQISVRRNGLKKQKVTSMVIENSPS